MTLNLANALRSSPALYGHLAIFGFATINAGGFAVGIALGSSTSGAALVSKFILKALAGGAMMCVVMTLFVHLNKMLETDVGPSVKFACVLFGFLLFAAVRSIHTVVQGPVGHDGNPKSSVTPTPSPT